MENDDMCVYANESNYLKITIKERYLQEIRVNGVSQIYKQKTSDIEGENYIFDYFIKLSDLKLKVNEPNSIEITAFDTQQEGNKYILNKVIDNNVIECKVVYDINDLKDCEIVFEGLTDNCYVGTDYVEKTLDINFSDDIGLKEYEIIIDNEVFVNKDMTNQTDFPKNSDKFNLLLGDFCEEDREYIIKVIATDLAGNKNESIFKFILDCKAPQAISYECTQGNNFLKYYPFGMFGKSAVNFKIDVSLIRR